MIANIPYIEQKFEEFNQQMFAGKLPKLPIELSDAKTFLGVCVYNKRKGKDGKVIKSDFRLRINTRIDLPEDVVEDTIIHEMIHYFIGVNQIEDTSAHGPLFLHMMNTINERFGRHITVSHRGTKAQNEQAIDKTSRWHVVATVHFTNGKFGVKVIPRVLPKILTYYNKMSENKDVKSIELYMSNNPYFNRFPNSGALNVSYVEQTVVKDNLKDAEKLECNGTNIKRAR